MLPIRSSLAIALALALSGAADAGAEPETEVVLAWFDDAARIERVAPLLGHAQVDRAKGVLRTEADAALRKALTEAGFRVETDVEATARIERLQRAVAGDKSIPGYACYRTVEETEAEMTALAAAYPQLLSLQDAGSSWQALAGNPGYALTVAVATNAARPGPKPRLFVMASVHAREYTPAELATRFIEDLVLGHGNDAEATWLLDRFEVHALLQANPDGRKRAEAGISWRKNRNTTHCGTGSRPGVDLNRNFPFEWGAHGGSSGDACQDTYRGPSPGSEPETSAVVDYVRALFPDSRGDSLVDPAPLDTQGLFFDLHSYAGLVLWPWGFTDTPAPNAAGLAKLGRRLAWFNGYTAEQAIGLYPTDGTTDDFAYGELGLPAYTFELGSAFFQDCASFESAIFPDNSAALRYAARSLHAPYRLPFGPDVTQLRIEPDVVVAGDSVQLEASLDDSRMQTQVTGASGPVPPVQAMASAAAYLGSAPWEPGAVAMPMQAADGAFDASQEAATLTLDTSGFASGKQLVFVQGRDAEGNDGPPQAVFLHVLDAAEAVRFEGSVRQAGTGLPLAATVRSGSYQAQTDPADGGFSRVLPPGAFDVEVLADEHEPALVFGLPGSPGSTVERDFVLYRLCPLLEDAAEVGAPSPFSPTAPWTLRASGGNGGGGAWFPSASGAYANNVDAALTGPVLDLGEYAAPSLGFDSRCDTEAGWDYGIVEVSSNGGASWSEVFRCDGETAWRRVELPLPALAGSAAARVRFRFDSDGVVTAPGWAIDNIRLLAGGPACRAGQTPPPVAIQRFDASPAAIDLGNPSTLAWTTQAASACQIEAIGSGSPEDLGEEELDSGLRVVQPATTTVYRLSCEGQDGPAQAETMVTVRQPARIDAFLAEPDTVIEGESTRLSWQIREAIDCSLADDAGSSIIELEPSELASGERDVSPASSRIYTLACSGEGGADARQVAVTVSLPAPGADPVFGDGFEARE